ncbi:hypothetical protein GA0061098_103452 [Bradyrhizobium shewense]|uniref:Uncharacterized protein n=1 Tax=Bradyrhizobium shewense TaxID=1761772 RepID=A0A1C3XS41_9BRAD|nr:hypothetical protein [Bradyrhizobium shewense]SCB55078.1 hypothetical protein GA0061098_103452 [Bradyrhizobium shewense]
MNEFPETVTFSVYKQEMPKPTVVVRRDGSLKPKNPEVQVSNLTILVQMPDEWISITSAQYRAMVQLARIALRHNPLARVIFCEGASPWGLDFLPGYSETWTTVTQVTLPPGLNPD